MQTHHHAPLPSWLPPQTYHPIFHRIKEIIPTHVEHGSRSTSGYRSAPVSPISPAADTVSTAAVGGAGGYFEQHTPEEASGRGYEVEVYGEEVGEVQWEKRFVKCSYAMVRLPLARSSTLGSRNILRSPFIPSTLSRGGGGLRAGWSELAVTSDTHSRNMPCPAISRPVAL